ncbi:GDSL-type esterase/lipase family protein [Nocardia brevicatena]|uniref:GDSL-type esterase/lipase family protein n=1 Tax=Nocardia brevicatena TaxID=37327 RepID=UPI0002D9CC25|nr:GDSL-type esterase/lipase family protein [Nocardia brevicatena]
MHTEPHWISTAITPNLLRGALELERTEHGVLPHRLPAWARAQCSDPQLTMAESQPSGVRVVFRTRATALELDTLPGKRVYVGAPPRPEGRYDLVVDGHRTDRVFTTDGRIQLVDLMTGAVEDRPGQIATLRFTGLPERLKDVEIWLPYNETTELVALRADAEIEPVVDTDRRVWLHHGSSISQGSNAAGPSSTWPAVAAGLDGVELINLGLAGSALLDPFTARTIRDTPADLIGLEMGINLVNSDVMRLRAFTPAVHGFLDTIREGHPTAPLLVVSPFYCPIHEDTPGPGAFDLEALRAGELRFRATGEPGERAAGKLTLTVIREELSRIVEQRAAEDPNLHYLDGMQLYGPKDFAELPLPDGLHPDAATHRLIGERFTKLVFGGSGPFSTDRRP